jgi:pyruvate formate lyase activating enzyme
MRMKEALLYEQLEGHRVRCYLCAHRCIIAEGRVGVCAVRENRGGILVSLVYGQVISQAVDTVEKKPLYHFLPGSTAFSFATVGCNFSCAFCQNAEISQMPRDSGGIEGRSVEPDRIVDAAVRLGCQSIAYTYTEPTVSFEFSLDVAVRAHAAGILNVYVTNGYMTSEMLEVFYPYLDAANVDLKSFRDATYRRECGAHLAPVLATLQRMKRMGVWVEVTTLVVPGMNDEESELRDIAQFIADLGVETPWHISRFHPAYRSKDRPPTPLRKLETAREIGKASGLRYVYVGNVHGEQENTLCPTCGRAVIGRQGFQVVERHVAGGRCGYCGGLVDGVRL